MKRIAAWIGAAACLLAGAGAGAQREGARLPQRGVVLTPRNFPNHSPADVEDMLVRAGEVGSFGIIKLRWSEKDHFTVASAIVRLAAKAGVRSVVEFSAIDARGGKSASVAFPDALSRTAGRRASFASPAVLESFVQAAGALAELGPADLALGTEVNVLAASDREQFDAFVRAYHQAYAAAKRASPRTRVFVTFSWEAIARQGDPQRAAELIDAFRPDLDVLAFSSDPTDDYDGGGPSSVPADYYDRIAALRKPGEPLLLEVGWRGDGKRGPAAQAEFIRGLPARTAKAGPDLLAWNFLHDVRVIVFNVGLGLLQRGGERKPAFDAFASLGGPRPAPPPAALDEDEPGAAPLSAARALDSRGAAPREREERAPRARRLAIARLGEEARGGIFDPSFASDGGKRIWMSYSTVAPSPQHGSRFNSISTHLAYSDDGGEEWQESGPVNRAGPAEPPRGHRGSAAVWEHEVSRLAYDRWASPETRWKLLWHRYLRVYDGKAPESTPLFQHGWMELRTAPTPEGPWTEGRKLFAGRAYEKADDAVLGPPQQRLDRLFPGKQALGRCDAFTEPGMVAREEGIYVVLRCAKKNDAGRVVELRCDHEFESCEYRGALLEDAQAAAFGYQFSGFSGTDIVDKDGDAYLIATPTRQPGESYHGCLFFKIDSLADARLQQEGGKPAVALEVKAQGPVFNGACGYPGPGSKAGVFLSQFSDRGPANFQIMRSGKHPR